MVESHLFDKYREDIVRWRTDGYTISETHLLLSTIFDIVVPVSLLAQYIRTLEKE